MGIRWRKSHWLKDQTLLRYITIDLVFHDSVNNVCDFLFSIPVYGETVFGTSIDVIKFPFGYKNSQLSKAVHGCTRLCRRYRSRTMESLPNEMLYEMAAWLPLADLRQFRLADRRCAAIGLPILVRHLYVLNTIACLQEFRDFLKTIPTAYTRALTIYHGKWPGCSRKEWETHPLHRYEQFSRPRGSDEVARPITPLASSAFRRYREFLSREDARSYQSDLDIIADILKQIPNLRHVTIETLQPFGAVTTRMARCVIRSLQDNPNIHSLDMRGRIRPSILHDCPIPCTITTLRVNYPAGGPLRPGHAPLSIPSHTQLRILEVHCPARPRLVLAGALPQLQCLYLQGCIIPEESLLLASSGRHFARMHLCDITLSEGTWQSFFPRMRARSSKPLLVLQGEFYGYDPSCFQFEARGHTLNLLYSFMASTIPWPLQDMFS
ncbi:hypothetical protein F4679DRAFT_544159 [Xylaria curta]|nr:hypothetical protein F4679DRAFT_544159 [Xylaria curta]